MAGALLFWQVTDLLHLSSYTQPFIVKLKPDEVLCRGVCIARFRDWRNV
jgi:hypothetical protein